MSIPIFARKNKRMILSMTGFGKASGNYKDKKINVEFKSLNGKTTDIRFKLSTNLREKEVYLRNLILDHAKRGKMECVLNIQAGDNVQVQLNTGLFKAYIREIKAIETEMGIASTDLSSALLRIPNVVLSDEPDMPEEEWEAIKEIAIQALNKLRDFRAEEGRAMEDDLRARAASISEQLEQIIHYEGERVTRLREKMARNLEDFMGKENVDKNRYEQEVIYYMEKLDINEEKVRLAQHCTFFIQELDSSSETSGRKLSFIAQEMGREINTLGAKAQHSEIQKLVVTMKDDLEKIKEQLANIV